MNIIRSNTFIDAGVTDQKVSIYEKRDIQKEVLMILAFIRQKKYLENPTQNCVHTDLSKSKNLSPKLVNFTAQSPKNIHEYLPKL